MSWGDSGASLRRPSSKRPQRRARRAQHDPLCPRGGELAASALLLGDALGALSRPSWGRSTRPVAALPVPLRGPIAAAPLLLFLTLPLTSRGCSPARARS